MIYVDTREKENSHIIKSFVNIGIEFQPKALKFGDYQNADPELKVCIERKKNLVEFAGNCGKGHSRFKKELERAKESGYKLIILIEQPMRIEDLPRWTNFMAKTTFRTLKDGTKKAIPPMNGRQIYAIIKKWCNDYDIEVMFCTKTQSPIIISTILRGLK